MRRILLTTLTLALVGLFGVVASSGPSAQPTDSTFATGFRQCPKQLLALPSEAVARAADQARLQAPFLYEGFGPPFIVVRSQRARWAGPRGKQVKAQCGQTVAERTVVVDLFFPKMLPSASLSQGTVFVSLLQTGYSVWEKVK